MCMLLYVDPFIISQDNQNNTYVVTVTISNKVRATYNQAKVKKILRLRRKHSQRRTISLFQLNDIQLK